MIVHTALKLLHYEESHSMNLKTPTAAEVHNIIQSCYPTGIFIKPVDKVT